jgi:hypothetical protein
LGAARKSLCFLSNQLSTINLCVLPSSFLILPFFVPRTGRPASADKGLTTILFFSQLSTTNCQLSEGLAFKSFLPIQRSNVSLVAVQHLGRIVRENGALVARKVWESTGRALIDSGVSKAEDIAGATRGFISKISPWRKAQVTNDE